MISILQMGHVMALKVYGNRISVPVLVPYLIRRPKRLGFLEPKPVLDMVGMSRKKAHHPVSPRLRPLEVHREKVYH